jgi:hypothetical protein
VSSGPKVTHTVTKSVVCGVRTAVQLWCRNDESPKTAKEFLVTKENLGYIFFKKKHTLRTYKLTYAQRKNCNTFDFLYDFDTPCMLKGIAFLHPNWSKYGGKKHTLNGKYFSP